MYYPPTYIPFPQPAYPLTPEEELEMLKEYKRVLEEDLRELQDELRSVEERIRELEERLRKSRGGFG